MFPDPIQGFSPRQERKIQRKTLSLRERNVHKVLLSTSFYKAFETQLGRPALFLYKLEWSKIIGKFDSEFLHVERSSSIRARSEELLSFEKKKYNKENCEDLQRKDGYRASNTSLQRWVSLSDLQTSQPGSHSRECIVTRCYQYCSFYIAISIQSSTRILVVYVHAKCRTHALDEITWVELFELSLSDEMSDLKSQALDFS